MTDSHLRSVFKAVTWRIGGSGLTFVIALMLTGKVRLAMEIGLLDSLFKIGAFYLHERLWDRVGLGRRQKPEYEI